MLCIATNISSQGALLLGAPAVEGVEVSQRLVCLLLSSIIYRSRAVPTCSIILIQEHLLIDIDMLAI